MPADICIRWLLLWFSAISGVAGDALGNWMQGSALTLASLASSRQVRINDDLNNGTCGYGQMRNWWPLVGQVAFSAANPAVQGLPMNACGSCWEMQCTSSVAGKDTCSSALNTSITVSMVGWCSECQQHEVLLEAASHAMLADTAAPQVEYRQVECMPSGKIQVAVTDYTMDNSTISLHFTGAGGAGSLQAVQIGHSDGGAANSWLSMQNTAGAAWTAELMFFGCAPFDLRLTDVLGQTVLLRQVIPFQGFVGSAQTGVQFGVRPNSTGIEADGNPPRMADPGTQSLSSSSYISDPMSSASLSVPDRTTSPESPNPASPSTSLSPSGPAAVSGSAAESASGPASLSTSTFGSPASHAAKPTLSSNASSPAVPLLCNDSSSQASHNPATSFPAVHALPPLVSSAAPDQATSPQSADESQRNISPSNTSNTMKPSPEQNPSQSTSRGVPIPSPQQDNQLDPPALGPALAAPKTTSPGPPPAAFDSQTGAAGQMGTAPEQSPASPQQMPADSIQAMRADSAALLPLPGSAPAPAPASSRAAAAPGDAQALHEKTHNDNLPVVVLGALLGVAIAALLAAMCLLLGFGAFWHRRRPTLVREETNTEAQPDTHLFASTHSREDSLICLQDNYGGGSWKHDTAYQGENRWRSLNEPAHIINAVPTAYEEVHSGLRHAQTLSAGQPTRYTASPLEATASGGAGSRSVAVQQAVGQSTMQQLEQEGLKGLAVLEVQTLDISQAGLLRLKLFQDAGNLLLQGLQVRQSTEARVHRGWTALSRVNASTWQMESFFLKPPFDLHVTGSLGETLTLRRALMLNQDSNLVIRMKAARGSLQQGDDVLSQQPLAAGPHFFSMKSPDPAEQEIAPVASRISPAPYPDTLMKPRTNVLDSWPSSTSLDGADSRHVGLSSTYSSLQQYAMEDFPSTSPGFIPTPAGMDVRASKAASRVPVHEAGMQATVHKLDFAVGQVTQKKILKQKPVLSVSDLIQHYPPVSHHHTSSESSCESDSQSVFSESASTLELHTVPRHFGARNFGRVNSLFRSGSHKERQAGWRSEQLAGSCIPVSGSSVTSGPRGQYANWARPPDALMGTAFSFQSELLQSYTPSLHSGACSAGSHASVIFEQPNPAGGAMSPMDEEEGGAMSDLESTDWPFDGMSCHSPAILQHGDTVRPAHAVSSSTDGLDDKQHPGFTEISDSAWETMQHEKHMKRRSDSSGSTMTYETSFIKHVGDKLFDSLAK